jgi:hypothetical protein
MKQILKSLELIQDGETTITITPEDYIGANYYLPTECPVSRAIQRELGAVDVKFGCCSCYIDDCNPREDEGDIDSQYHIDSPFTKEDHENLLKSGGSLTKRLIRG